MKALLQRVQRAQVTVEGATVGAIGPGLLVLLGVAQGDTQADATVLAEKTAQLRIFPDGAGRFNRSVLDAGGAVLVVSQFTLLADTRRGRRPSFTGAAPPEAAQPLVEAFCAALRAAGLHVASGRFGAHMLVSLENDGPVTLMLESKP
ncbi:MAG: D-tyrosyl-tRNA(Tyr) deacylase [Chloroflexi bacterium]|nr:D-tyrosyl-tRNA(Tyr) deacylase [Chloroflexota bacterium]